MLRKLMHKQYWLQLQTKTQQLLIGTLQTK